MVHGITLTADIVKLTLSEFVVDSLVQGRGQAYQDRQDFYWHTCANSAGGPSYHQRPPITHMGTSRS